MNLLDIFTQRRRHGQDLFLKNAKYIFNDHTILVLFFLLGALAFQYSGWIEILTQGAVPLYVHIIWSLIMAAALFMTGLASHVQEADLVFLLPMESKYDEWFRPALNTSLILPSLIILLMVAGSYPLLAVMVGYTVTELLVLALILITFKIAHLNILLESWHFHSERFIRNHKIVLWLVVLITIFLASYVTPYLCLGIALVYLIAIHFTGIRPFSPDKKRWHWDKIVVDEQGRQQQIRRILALFVNMPQEASGHKRRKYLDPIVNLSNRSSNPYTYLFSRAFWRSKDYYPLWGRMTLIGMLYLIFVANNHWLNIVVVILFQYFSHLQVLPLAQKMNQHVLLQVYPIDHDLKISGFAKMIWQPLCTQIVLFTIVSLITHQWQFAGLVLISSIVFSLFFAYVYLPRFIRKKEKKHRNR